MRAYVYSAGEMHPRVVHTKEEYKYLLIVIGCK